MIYLNSMKGFWQEVELRAENNYGPFGTGEEIEVNINKAIQEMADELKESTKAIETKHGIRIDHDIDT